MDSGEKHHHLPLSQTWIFTKVTLHPHRQEAFENTQWRKAKRHLNSPPTPPSLYMRRYLKMHSGEKTPPSSFVTNLNPHLHLACYTSSHNHIYDLHSGEKLPSSPFVTNHSSSSSLEDRQISDLYLFSWGDTCKNAQCSGEKSYNLSYTLLSSLGLLRSDCSLWLYLFSCGQFEETFENTTSPVVTTPHPHPHLACFGQFVCWNM